MTALTTTVFRIVTIGSKRYALGLHPGNEAHISIRPIGRRIGYLVPASRVRIEGALAYGRAEQAAKREARRNGIPWQRARILANIIPPTIKRKHKSQIT